MPLSSRCKDVLDHGEKLFQDRSTLVTLWQEMAENFYPERAHFTASPSIGTDFASSLTTSYPLLARRDMGNQIGSMLRPTQKEWFHMVAGNRTPDHEGKLWLERANKIQRRAMYDRKSMFVRAVKEGDHDFATFGQCVISVEMAPSLDRLLYRCWHLRDVAWCEDTDGSIGEVHVKWEPTVRALISLIGKKGSIHENVTRDATTKPHREVKVRWIVMKAEDYYDGTESKRNLKAGWVSLLIDVENEHEMLAEPMRSNPFVIPRWQTVSGSQYAYSPATICALPDARLIQSMTQVILDAGEKGLSPPMIATKEAIRGDVDLYAGGITWVDAAYDERLGEVLRPLSIDPSGVPAGMEMRQEVKTMIAEAFYLNKLNLPPYDGSQMTAYEVGQRVQEYIRQALPIFEPMETDYNGAICDLTFDLLLHNGGFGPVDQIPDSIQGGDIEFKFESPLHDAIEKEKVQIFGVASNLLAQAVALDPTAAFVVDAKTALREALAGAGAPIAWTNSEDMVESMAEAQAQQAQQQQLLAAMQQGADVAQKLGNTPGMAGSL